MPSFVLRASLLIGCSAAIYAFSATRNLAAGQKNEAWGVSSELTAGAAAIAPGASAVEWRILENPNGPHTALFFAPTRQVFAVYHIDSGSGEIKLKSVRSLSADLQLPHFNSNDPAPRDVQTMLNEAR